MLRQSFAFIPGIGPVTEQKLWEAGIEDWSTLLSNLNEAPIGSADREATRETLDKAIQAFESQDSAFFKKVLGIREAWRAYPEFKESTVYLDIETDGGQSPSSITLIGLYDGQDFHGLLKGKDIDAFPELMSKFKMVVTFYGSGFDIPMLQKRFKDYPFDQVHFDLCPALKRLGYHGGLKKIERTLGIQRSEDTTGLNGYDAVKLWNRYHHLDDEHALELLIAYNKEDVVNLEWLAGHTYDRLRIETLLNQKP